MSTPESSAGHRARLRERFQADPDALVEAEMLELLLTYAIPRQDVAPPSRELLERCRGLAGVMTASRAELLRVPGIGEQAATLVELTGRLAALTRQGREGSQPASVQLLKPDDATVQTALFDVEPNNGPLFESLARPAEPEMRTFANDETANALALIPEAHRFADAEEFRAFLRDRLPYNSISTRRRRATYIIERFFPDGQMNTPLAYFAAHCESNEHLKPALFYHLLRAEPLAAKMAEELVWPAVPLGQIDREQIREFVLRHLPEIGPASQSKVLQSLSNSFTQLGVATGDGRRLHFQIHPGTLAGFLYVLTALFPRPGMYSFGELENGPMRRWLLWDREWMRRQFYNLQDLGIISKVSEIDTIRQFTIGLDQAAALQRFFAFPPQDLSALREGPGPDA
jgi:hypothetical protein